MSVATKTKKSSGASYKSAWKRLLDLRGQSGAAAFERATLLVDVFEDQDFRADNGGADDGAAAEILDDLVDDLGVTFLELRRMLKHFPAVDEWRTGRLRSMNTRCREAEAAARKAERGETEGRRASVKVSDHEAVKEELAREKTRASFLREQHEAASAKAESLEQEVARLRLENATLKGRIAELERIIKRELEESPSR